MGAQVDVERGWAGRAGSAGPECEQELPELIRGRARKPVEGVSDDIRFGTVGKMKKDGHASRRRQRVRVG